MQSTKPTDSKPTWTLLEHVIPQLRIVTTIEKHRSVLGKIELECKRQKETVADGLTDIDDTLNEKPSFGKRWDLVSTKICQTSRCYRGHLFSQQ